MAYFALSPAIERESLPQGVNHDERLENAADQCSRCSGFENSLSRGLDEGLVCRDCSRNSTRCSRCRERIPAAVITVEGDRVCRYCAERYYDRCFNCRAFTADSRYISGGFRACLGCAQRYSECDLCGTLIHDAVCDSCEFQGNVRSYSYKPDPRFFGQGPVHLGLELEIIVPNYNYDSSALLVSDCVGRTAYLKFDSSIQPLGFELVTHPMDYRFAIDKFPWDLLDRLRQLGCTSDERVGLHVHVSRAGFDSPTHIYRWAKLIYRNETHAIRLARRRTHYAAFTATARSKVKHAAKDELRHYGLDRYQAINPHPRNSLELRIFAGSLDRQYVQAALAFVDASVEYTRRLTSTDVLRDGGWEWSRFVDWVCVQDRYAPLRAELEALECAC